MNKIILIGIIVLAIILVIIAFIIVLKSQKNKKKQIPEYKQEIDENYIDFEDLMQIAKNQNSSSKDLLNILKIFNQNYIIDDENEQKYLIFFSKVLNHSNVNKDIFQYFHKEIKNKNFKYKKDLELIEKKALG